MSSVHGIVNVPNLQALDIEAVRSEENAFIFLLGAYQAATLRLDSMRLHPSDITALLTNHKVRASELDDIEIAPEDIPRLGEHPTLMRLRIDGAHYNLHRPEIVR
jgi:hypothetical protein